MDKAAIVGCPIVVVDVVMLCGTASVRRMSASGQELPRSLAAVVSALPRKAAAKISDRGGS